MAKYVSLTNRRFVSTKTGHIYQFEAGKPIDLPEGFVQTHAQQLLGEGFAPVGDDGGLVVPTTEEAVEENPAELEFDQAVFEAAVQDIIARNHPDEVTENGNPRVKAVMKYTGFPVTSMHILNFMKEFNSEE